MSSTTRSTRSGSSSPLERSVRHETFFTVVAQVIPVLLLTLGLEVRTQFLRDRAKDAHPISVLDYWPTTAALVPAELLALLVLFREDMTTFDAILVGIPITVGLWAVFQVMFVPIDRRLRKDQPSAVPENIEGIDAVHNEVITLMRWFSGAAFWFLLGYLPLRLFFDPAFAAIAGLGTFGIFLAKRIAERRSST